MTQALKNDGTFLQNTRCKTIEEIEEKFPP